MLSPPGNRRERILLYGPANAGKSTAWLWLAEMIQKTKSPAQVFTIDTDSAWSAMDPGTYTHVHVFDVDYWREYIDAMNMIYEKAGKDDWLVVDMADKPWSKAQEYFFEQRYGSDMDEFYVKSQKGEIDAGEDWNWGYINKIYHTFDEKMQRFPGHVLAVCPTSEVRRPNKAGKGGDAAVILDTFGKWGVKPSGQKGLPHLFHTILLLQESPEGYVINTVKERNPPIGLQRELLKKKLVPKMAGFVVVYLIGVAGWKM